MVCAPREEPKNLVTYLRTLFRVHLSGALNAKYISLDTWDVLGLSKEWEPEY